jgi:hypothetical protein
VSFKRKKQAFLNSAYSPALLFAGALVVGISLRIGSLAQAPLNFDEAECVYIARMPLSSVLEKNGAFNSSPPAMLLLLHFVLKLGDSEEFVRAISVLAGIATIGVVYQIGKQIDQTRYCGALAALLFALSSQQILLSRQFRVYALGELFGALGLLAALAFARRPNWVSASLTGLLFFIGIQVQYANAPFFASVGFALLYRRNGISALGRAKLGHLALIAGVAVLGIGVAYESALKYQMYPGRGTSYASTLFSSSSWLEEAILFLVQSWYLIVSGLSLEGMPWSGLVLTVFCVSGAWLLARRNGRDPYLVATFASILVFAMLSVANYYPYGPVRQCLILTLPLYGLAALGVADAVSSASWTRRVVVLATLALLPLGSAVRLASHTRPGQPADPNGSEMRAKGGDFREAMRVLQTSWKAGDAIFVPPGSFPIFDYYSRRFPIRPWIAAEGSMEWMQDERAWPALIKSEPAYATQLDALTHSSSRIWIPYSHYHPGEMSFPTLAARHGWMDRVETVMSGRMSEVGEGNELYLFHR